MNTHSFAKNNLYQVTFFGKTTNNQSRSTVAKRFAAAFNLRDINTLRKLFSGKAITLKKGLTHHQAHRYGQIMMEMGADCCIEPETSKFSFDEQMDDNEQKEYEKKKRQKMAMYSTEGIEQLSIAAH